MRLVYRENIVISYKSPPHFGQLRTDLCRKQSLHTLVPQTVQYMSKGEPSETIFAPQAAHALRLLLKRFVIRSTFFPLQTLLCSIVTRFGKEQK